MYVEVFGEEELNGTFLWVHLVDLIHCLKSDIKCVNKRGKVVKCYLNKSFWIQKTKNFLKEQKNFPKNKSVKLVEYQMFWKNEGKKLTDPKNYPTKARELSKKGTFQKGTF